MEPSDQREDVLFAEALKRPSGSAREAFPDVVYLGDFISGTSYEARLWRATPGAEIAAAEAQGRKEAQVP